MNTMSHPHCPPLGPSPSPQPQSPEGEPRAARGEASGLCGSHPPPQRWRAKRKAEVVLRILRGEPLDNISREQAVPIDRLQEWRDQALSGMEQALQGHPTEDPAQLKLDEANRRIGELTMENELLRVRAEKSGPFVTRRLRP